MFFYFMIQILFAFVKGVKTALVTKRIRGDINYLRKTK